ncbi:MAG TPA: DUF2946 domain-containing protein [Bradyrhizobium sp.]|uniref:DUF2946 domain-containing protein n=1 Tax=Bradyrhizobium sp. TaxID=376 RepID=UPI002C532FE7|nr:DUF2946 domain-containing protein [Bradyrhizobium sp.]HLZ04312.1 DUF2946 domain-containing protein [Bradyrhizobium sp.]
MKWFRSNIKSSNIKSGVRLTLFALLVQFALSCGHFHALAATSPAKVIKSALPSSSQADAGKLAIGKRAQQAPGKHERRGPDGCAICAVMAMAGTVVFASPPILLLPEAVELLYRSTDAEFVHLKSAGVAFQPRAPPAS